MLKYVHQGWFSPDAQSPGRIESARDISEGRADFMPIRAYGIIAGSTVNRPSRDRWASPRFMQDGFRLVSTAGRLLEQAH